MGKQVQSPPIINETHSEPPRYLEAELAQPCSSLYNPCLSTTVLIDLSDNPMYWPNYTWQPYQPYYAAIPATAAVPIPSTGAPPSAMQHSVCPAPQPQAQTGPSSETQNSLPLGSYEMNGTTYFPAPIPSAPPPPPYSIPVHPVPYNHPVAPVYPYYAPPTLLAGYYDIPNQMRDVGSVTSFDPFDSDPMMHIELPVIPRLEDYQMSPIQHDVLPLSLASPFAPSDDLGLTITTGKPAVTQEHEFPYRPPKNQRVGHARRISVNIKKQGRANSG